MKDSYAKHGITMVSITIYLSMVYSEKKPSISKVEKSVRGKRTGRFSKADLYMARTSSTAFLPSSPDMYGGRFSRIALQKSLYRGICPFPYTVSGSGRFMKGWKSSPGNLQTSILLTASPPITTVPLSPKMERRSSRF